MEVIGSSRKLIFQPHSPP